MPRDLDDWASRIKAIEREHLSVLFATRRLLSQAGDDPTILGRASLRFRDAEQAIGNLEGTCLIRCFSEFEAALRKFWGLSRSTHPPMKDLVNGNASRCKIDDALIVQVHGVREYRNALVHEREEEVAAVALSDARRAFCTFLGRLPPVWS